MNIKIRLTLGEIIGIVEDRLRADRRIRSTDDMFGFTYLPKGDVPRTINTDLLELVFGDDVSDEDEG